MKYLMGNRRGLLALALVVSVAMGLAGCGALKEKATEALKEKAEELKAQQKEQRDQQAQKEQKEKEAQAAAEAAKPQPKDPKAWMDGDFRVEFDYSPMSAVPQYKDAAARMLEHITVVRVGDVLYKHSVNKSAESHNLYRVEDGKVVRYQFNPKNKRAVRTVQKVKDINKGVRNLFSENIGSQPAGLAKMRRAGTEEVAGIECDVFVKEADNSKAKGLAQLGALVGANTDKLAKAMDMSGVSTYWIDQEDWLVARAHTRMVMQGKEADADRWIVKSFQKGNIDPKEVAFDLSGYELMK